MEKLTLQKLKDMKSATTIASGGNRNGYLIPEELQKHDINHIIRDYLYELKDTDILKQ